MTTSRPETPRDDRRTFRNRRHVAGPRRVAVHIRPGSEVGRPFC